MATLAISTRHLPTDECRICFELLDSEIARLGPAVIHSGPRGGAHPFHKECLLEAIRIRPECPMCREIIRIDGLGESTADGFGKSTAGKIRSLVIFTLTGASFHYFASSVTGSPRLGAIIPVVVLSALIVKDIIDEAREVGFADHLKMKIVGLILISSISISILLGATYLAENVTELESRRSFIIAGIFSAFMIGLSSSCQRRR